MDLSQQFKRISGRMSYLSALRLTKRVEKRWGCTAVIEQTDRFRGRSVRLLRRAFRQKGRRVWSFRDLLRMVRWTNAQMVTRCGVHVVKRKKGTPMGSAFSPIKAEVATSEMERRAWSNDVACRRKGFTQAGERPRDVLDGKIIADDAVVFSKLLWPKCIRRFIRWTYKRPLVPELEAEGQDIDLADRKMKIFLDSIGEEDLEAFRMDKNEAYVVGMAPSPPRVRFTPNLGYTTTRQISAWIIGRFHDELKKNLTSYRFPEVCAVHAVDTVAEILLLNYSRARVFKALKYVRTPELHDMRDIARNWVLGMTTDGSTETDIKRNVWDFHVMIGIVWKTS
jgi:hypothetical protein